jgi:phosphate transport system ATP-binding protein
MTSTDKIIRTENLNLWYGEKQALYDITMGVLPNKITALIGPSGCGKSTLIRCFNRMNDVIDKCKITGKIFFHGNDIYEPDTDAVEVRKKIGMVFQKPNPFPKTIYENVAYGSKIQGITNKNELDDIVETSLKNAALWRKSKTDSMNQQWDSLVVSSNDYVSPDPFRSNQRSF